MKKIIMSFLFAIFLLIGGVFWINDYFKINNDQLDDVGNRHLVTVQGAVQNPSTTLVPHGTKVKTVIQSAHKLLSSDLKDLDLERLIIKSEEIYVPYKTGFEPKIDGRDGLTVNEAKQLGVNQKIQRGLIRLFKENNNLVSWDQIDDLPGVGSITLARLKKLLIIHPTY